MAIFPLPYIPKSRYVLKPRASAIMLEWPSYFDAEPFYKGVKFRGIKDGLAEWHLEGSECCLIHRDMAEFGKAKGKGYG
jgi:hypothetical protein